MKNIVIVGGGFAGLWAALSATRSLKLNGLSSKAQVKLINVDKYHGIRPRYYENNLSDARINLTEITSMLDIELVIGEVTAIDTDLRTLTLNDKNSNTSKCHAQYAQEISYDKLVLAAGSSLVVPENIPGAKEYSFNVDTYSAAAELQRHLSSLASESKQNNDGRYTVVVIGGGFTGIEIATELRDRMQQLFSSDIVARIIIIDRNNIANGFSSEMQQQISTALQDLNIESMPNSQVKSITADAIVLESGEIIKARTVIWATGMRASRLNQQFNLKLDKLGRLPVDRYLRLNNLDNCFAAGDVAAATTDGTHTSMMSCQHAMPQGRVAGYNAVADAFGLDPVMYEQVKYVTCLDLGSWGAVYSEGWEQSVVKTKQAAKKIKLYINHDRIYPPSTSDGTEKLLACAEPCYKELDAG